ncbi:MAG: hypothetical protein AABN95_00040 [Acidobacteriota bacterium]
MLYFVFAIRTLVHKHSLRYKLGTLMPYSSHLRISTGGVVYLAGRLRHACAALIEPQVIHNYRGIISPQNLSADAGDTHHPPNLTTI